MVVRIFLILRANSDHTGDLSDTSFCQIFASYNFLIKLTNHIEVHTNTLDPARRHACMHFNMAPEIGIEPIIPESKSGVLPLHYSGTYGQQLSSLPI